MPVPDERIGKLSALSNSAKTIPAVIEFVDIAGLVKGASSGEGLGNKFLSNIRETDMIAEVVRIFDDEDIHHVQGAVDPLSDIEVINLELVIADTETVAKRFNNVERDSKRGEKDAIAEFELLEKLLPHLEAGKLANTFAFTETQEKIVKHLHLLTMKPFLYVCNKKNGAYNFDENNDERWAELLNYFEENNAQYVTVDAGIEHELKDLYFANKVVKHTKSNTIVFAKNNTLIASGVGQTSRVDSLKQAVIKAASFGFDLKGAVMASDAFFPFPDGLEQAVKHGATAFIQPGGSVKDADVIAAANRLGVAMVFTGVRHFRH